MDTEIQQQGGSVKNPISTRRRLAVFSALQNTRTAQAEFWKSLGRLERLLGRELVSTIDYRDVDVELLFDPDRLKPLV